MDKIVYVTDRGSNLVKALEDYEVVNCFAHRLNNILKRTFYSAGTAEKNEKKKKKSIKNNQSVNTSNQFTPVLNNDDPLMDYDDRDSSDSENDDDIILNAKAVDLALRSLSSLPDCDHINVLEKNLAPPASQLLATIVRCKQLCCYVKRVFIIFAIDESGSLASSFVFPTGELEPFITRIEKAYNKTRNYCSMALNVSIVRKCSCVIFIINQHCKSEGHPSYSSINRCVITSCYCWYIRAMETRDRTNTIN